MLCDSNYCVIFWERQNYADSKKMSGDQKLGGKREEEMRERRGCFRQGKHSVWCSGDVVIRLSKSTACATARGNRNAIRNLGCVMLGQWSVQ